MRASAPNLLPSPDGCDNGVEQAVAELAAAARAAGIAPDDPMAPPLNACAALLRTLGTNSAALSRHAPGVTKRMDDALAHARGTAEAEAHRYHAQAKTVQADVVLHVAGTVARTAEDAITRRVMVRDQNRAGLAALALVFVLAASLGGGYWLGSATTLAGVQATKAGLRAAWAEHPAEAARWVALMRANSVRAALGRCAEPGRSDNQGGRAACTVPFWVDPPADRSGPPEQTPVPLVPVPDAMPATPPVVARTAPPPAPQRDDPMALIRPRLGPPRFGP